MQSCENFKHCHIDIIYSYRTNVNRSYIKAQRCLCKCAEKQKLFIIKAQLLIMAIMEMCMQLLKQLATWGLYGVTYLQKGKLSLFHKTISHLIRKIKKMFLIIRTNLFAFHFPLLWRVVTCLHLCILLRLRHQEIDITQQWKNTTKEGEVTLSEKLILAFGKQETVIYDKDKS